MCGEIRFERPFDVFFREATAKVERCARCILPRHLEFLNYFDDGVWQVYVGRKNQRAP